jgi:hypothetical protein
MIKFHLMELQSQPRDAQEAWLEANAADRRACTAALSATCPFAAVVRAR